MTKQAIAYYRVSTQRQGQSGLGLEGQRSAVTDFADQRGYDVIAEFTEVETGTNKRRRPVLAQAISQAKQTGATLLIAKLDRLARNVHFVAGLQEAGVKFVAVDNPDINEFVVHILVAVAQLEAKHISDRTKAALAARRARVKAGKEKPIKRHPMPKEVREAGREALREEAREWNRAIVDLIMTYREEMGLSYDHIARRLNEKGYRTRRGADFKAPTVHRIVQRELAAA